MSTHARDHPGGTRTCAGLTRVALSPLVSTEPGANQTDPHTHPCNTGRPRTCSLVCLLLVLTFGRARGRADVRGRGQYGRPENQILRSPYGRPENQDLRSPSAPPRLQDLLLSPTTFRLLEVLVRSQSAPLRLHVVLMYSPSAPLRLRVVLVRLPSAPLRLHVVLVCSSPAPHRLRRVLVRSPWALLRLQEIQVRSPSTRLRLRLVLVRPDAAPASVGVVSPARTARSLAMAVIKQSEESVLASFLIKPQTSNADKSSTIVTMVD